jgi:inner membrane protein
MDPVAHTLTGACMAQTGLRRKTPLATATLLIGANLPDIDGVVQFWGQDASLYHRRGWTHGILAMFILPVLLAAVIITWDRFIRRRKSTQIPAVKPWWILSLAYLGVLSHPLLDWLNTYGVRLLMPFDGQWFYGDLLFIIDPWMWLLMGAAVVFAHSKNWITCAAWIILGVVMTAMVVWYPVVPSGAKFFWMIGVLIIVASRIFGVSEVKTRRTSFLGFAGLVFYLGIISLGSGHARNLVAEFVSQHSGSRIMDMMVGPLPANPFKRMVVVKTSDYYQAFKVHLWQEPRLEPMYPPVRIQPLTPAVRSALGKNEIRGFVNWMRFPIFDEEVRSDGVWVTIRDLRYVMPDSALDGGIGVARVFVSRDDMAQNLWPMIDAEI